MTEYRLHTPRGTVCCWKNDWVPGRETLVFLHGLTADHTLFDRQVPHFADRYNLLVWDAPAHGKSRPYTDFSYPNAAENLRQLLDETGTDAAVLIGQSMGGYVIQSFLLRYPERAKAFVGIDTCPYGEAYYSRSDRWWLRQVGWMAGLFPLPLLRRAVARQCTRTEYARRNMENALAPYGKAELCRLMDAGFSGFLTDNQDMEIPCPTLLLCGEYDVTGKVRHYCRLWAAATGFPLRWITGAAHNANADAPEQVNEAIDGFLAGLEL